MRTYAITLKRAGAKSSAGCASPNSNRRNSAHHDGVFFMPVNYGGLCVGGFGLPDSYLSGLAHLRTVRHPSCASDLADSNQIGVTPMAQLRLSNLITRSLSSRAEAHRQMAKAALFADSSTRTRLKRYNHHIEKAQQLEARALETAKRSVGAVS
ncbi:hypothetical protein HPTD01_8 [Halomonas sp. TD01]|nr:hypothetical protein HPTD01_8 [Halomonas sp. TD01]